MFSDRYSNRSRHVNGRGTGSRVNGRGPGGQSRIDTVRSGYVSGRGHRHSQQHSRANQAPSRAPQPKAISLISAKSRPQDVIWVDVSIITAADILIAGLCYVNFEKERQVGVNPKENIERFREHYGVPPAAVTDALKDLAEKYPDMRYKYAFLAMHWLKAYGTERQMSGLWQISDLQTIREAVKEYTRRFASMEEDKIIFGGFEKNKTLRVWT